MATLIFIVVVLGILLIGQVSWIGWLVGLGVILLIVHIPPVKTNFLWWWGRFWTDNNTRLRTWWVANILLLLALVICTGQAIVQSAGGCTPKRAFVDLKDKPAAQQRAAFVAQGHVLCEDRISRAWFRAKTIWIGWGMLGLLVVGGIGYVPVALSDDLARATERRRTLAATRAQQAPQPPAGAVPVSRAFARGRFWEGLAAAGIMDVIVGAIIHDGRERS